MYKQAMSLPTPHLQKTIDACRRGERLAQKELYQQYYAYGLTVALHYAKDRGEAREILNEGFFRALAGIARYDSRKPFRPWLRRVMINVAIDHHRKHHAEASTLSLSGLSERPATAADGFDHLAMDDLLRMVQNLSPAYRIVFNLFVIEGFSHREIAERLDITVGASKSNLTRAKSRLRQMLDAEDRHLAKISES